MNVQTIDRISFGKEAPCPPSLRGKTYKVDHVRLEADYAIWMEQFRVTKDDRKELRVIRKAANEDGRSVWDYKFVWEEEWSLGLGYNFIGELELAGKE